MVMKLMLVVVAIRHFRSLIIIVSVIKALITPRVHFEITLHFIVTIMLLVYVMIINIHLEDISKLETLLLMRNILKCIQVKGNTKYLRLDLALNLIILWINLTGLE
jgi:hypothetical protein